MKRKRLWSPANQILALTWLFFGMYYVNRFNYSPMIPLLKGDLGLSNAQAGWLMAFFFLSYTAFQLPSGSLADHFGPRKVLTCGALISICGNFLFSQGSTFGVLSLAQCVNGLGQAMGWNSAIKLIVNWFSRARRGTAVGLFVTCVTLGSSGGIRLSGFLGDRFGWRMAFIIPPLMMAVLTLVFWIVVRDHPHERGLPDFDDERHLETQFDNSSRSGLSIVLTNRILWTVAMVYFCFVYVQFGCLIWIPSFLKEGYAMSVDRASTISALVLLPGIFASPISGFLSDSFFGGRRKPLIILGLCILSGSGLLLSFGMPFGFALGLLILVGFMIIMPDVLLAAYPSDILSRKLSGTGMGFLTTFTSLAGVITTPLSGKILDVFHSYGAVFFSFAIMALAGALLSLLIKEKGV